MPSKRELNVLVARINQHLEQATKLLGLLSTSMYGPSTYAPRPSTYASRAEIPDTEVLEFARIRTEPGDHVTTQDLYAAYTDWCRVRKVAPVTSRRFLRHFGQPRHKSNSTVRLLGVRLR